MSRAIRALVDGVPSDAIVIDDRGPPYGHGMFETCRVVGGTIPPWRHHCDPLRERSSPLTNAVIGVWPVKRVRGLAGARLTGRINAQIRTVLEAGFGFGCSR